MISSATQAHTARVRYQEDDARGSGSSRSCICSLNSWRLESGRTPSVWARIVCWKAIWLINRVISLLSTLALRTVGNWLHPVVLVIHERYVLSWDAGGEALSWLSWVAVAISDLVNEINLPRSALQCCIMVKHILYGCSKDKKSKPRCKAYETCWYMSISDWRKA